MKKIFAILVFSITFAWASAQTFEITQAERTSINGTYKSFLFDLPGVDQAQVEEDWKNWIDGHNAKAKYDKKNKIWYAENVKMPKLTKSLINVFANIDGEEYPEKRTSVIVWFALGEDYIPSDSLSKKGDDFDAQYALEALTKYAMTTSRNQAQTILDTENKRLDGFVKELKNLQKDKADYMKSLEKAKSAIAKNEGNIEENEQDQITKAEEIESQKKALELAKDYSLAATKESDAGSAQKNAESQVKSEEKRLSSLEKDLRKLLKDHEDYHKEIAKAENIIALNEMTIEINARDQENKARGIEKQKEIIELAKENVRKFNL